MSIEGLPIWTKVYPILVSWAEESDKPKITPLGLSLSQVILDNQPSSVNDGKRSTIRNVDQVNSIE